MTQANEKKRLISTFNVMKNGFIIGASMMVPGVSGGTMALILGIYDKLLYSISHIFKEFKTCFLFLLKFALGAILGFIVLGFGIGFLLENFPVAVRYFFAGAVLGGLPILFKKSGASRKSGKDIFTGIISFIIGVAVVFSLSFIPKSSVFGDLDFSLTGIVILLLTGIIIAIALVLPGISTSHMLIIMGVYYTILKNPMDNLLLIAVLGVSTLIGIFLITRFLEMLLRKFPKATYFCIIGFVMGSMNQLLQNDADPNYVFYVIPQGIEWILAIVTVVAGFAATYYLSLKESD